MSQATDDAQRHYASIPAGANIYVSTQGDWWDLISLRCYGMKRGDDHQMHRLIEANYYLRNVSQFPAGVAVIVPDAPAPIAQPLVPWQWEFVKP